MLLSHRSGMGVLPHQGEWDTQCSFYPDFIQDCSLDVVDVPLEEFYRERLVPGGSDFEEESWLFEPGQRYRYTYSAFGLMRCLMGRLSGQSPPEDMGRLIVAFLNGGQTEGFTLLESGEFPAEPRGEDLPSA